MEHTKLKFHKGFDKMYIYDDEHKNRIADIPNTGTLSKDEREANMKSLVKCWNSHDALLEILKNIVLEAQPISKPSRIHKSRYSTVAYRVMPIL